MDKENTKTTSTGHFVKEVAKYFMSFLETDFKKRRIPKRNTIQKIKGGFQVGLDLDKYPTLKKDINQLINSGFEKTTFEVSKGKYVNQIPENLMGLISRKINEFKQDDVIDAIKVLERSIMDLCEINKKSYDKFLEQSKEEIAKIMSKNFIIPLLDQIDKPLENLDLADENSKYQLEIELADALFSCFEERLTDILEKFFNKPKETNLNVELKKVFQIKRIIEQLTTFFENYSVKDAFLEIYQLDRNNKLIDKTELYLYFYELSLGKDEKFPLFYIPITLEKDEKKFKLSFENRVYVNTKAIDYVVQEYNLQSKKKNTLTGEFDRIIYLNEDKAFVKDIETLIKVLENFFEFTKNINIKDHNKQSTGHLINGLSNKQYLYLFDKSDEALINDYEEIINDNGDLLSNFTDLLNGFVFENPEEVISIVEEEWLDQPYSEKLIFQSPVPLNEEQKQILQALEKPDCKNVIIEGPPGTGKSHTITAIICKALLDGKSVLVLSDKKEALDVVEDKISSTLNKVRHEKDFQNPILRLGRSGNKFGKIVQGQTIQKIKDHYIAYRTNKSKFEEQLIRVSEEAKNSIKENIEYYENIYLKDVKSYCNKSCKYDDLCWIEEEDSEALGQELPKLRKIVANLKNKEIEPLKAEFVTKSNLLKIEKLISLLEDISELKDKLVKADFNSPEILLISNEINDSTKDFLKFVEQITILVNELVTLSNQISIKELALVKSTTYFKELDTTAHKYFLYNNQYKSAKKYLEGLKISPSILNSIHIPVEMNFEEAIKIVNTYIDDLKELKRPIIGFLFQSENIQKITKQFRKSFCDFNISNPTDYLKELEDARAMLEFIFEKSKNNEVSKEVWSLIRSNSEDQTTWSSFERVFDMLKPLNSHIKNIEDFKLEEIRKVKYICELFSKINDIQEFSHLMDQLNLEAKLSKEDLLKVSLKKTIEGLKNAKGSLEDLIAIKEDIDFILRFSEKYPVISEKISLNINSENLSELSCKIINLSEEEIIEYCKFKQNEQKLNLQFNGLPEDKYFESIENIEGIVSAQMMHFLDERIIDYSQKFAGDLETLKIAIKKNEKFPKDLFQNLKNAFPCILSGIRDYAEFIPLEKNLFDLIIIDEASQVSIAQALPALIRGKQVIVLGDDKQFSNVKSNNASKITNEELKQKVHSSFKEEFINDHDSHGWLSKVKENFDIKNSILQFMRFIRNYQCQLKKHFRCYPEIISYSDKHFYDNSLQCMKVRGKQIEEVIKFDILEHDGRTELKQNVNSLEAEHIIQQLQSFKEQGITQSIGIISPHREQVTYIFDKINNLKERDWLFNECNLKIMTFDTCQGEERDYVFYSMVATEEDDKLNYIFLKDFKSKDLETEGTVKAQRLNVGFSRAKECMHFVLSKPIESFYGEIKNALIHYENEIENSKKQIRGGTDDKSPMEYEIQQIFYKTKFYKENKESIELIPQFPIGDYIRRLNRSYKHPNYKVDFLLIFKDNKIIIEYDGFKEHFTDFNEVNESNHEFYLKAEDVYRQKILEGYGYRFLRINKFNIGKNPVETLDLRLNQLVKKKPKIMN